MAGAAQTATDMSGFDVVPGFNLTVMTSEPASFSLREIAGGVVLEPVGDLCGGPVLVVIEVVRVALATRS